VRNLHTQGSFVRTGNVLDVALNGQGYLQFTGANGEIVYSRAGALSKNAQGLVVNGDGLPLIPAMTVPVGATDVVINDAGQVFARTGANNQLQTLGQISLAKFGNDAGLEPIGGNLFKETAASGTPTVTAPAEVGVATVQQGYLENSNVDPVKEITELIAAQRAYEMNSKVVQAADDMYGVVAKGMR
jgi:flagellar basal-body rod protein FlgG